MKISKPTVKIGGFRRSIVPMDFRPQMIGGRNATIMEADISNPPIAEIKSLVSIKLVVSGLPKKSKHNGDWQFMSISYFGGDVFMLRAFRTH